MFYTYYNQKDINLIKLIDLMGLYSILYRC